MTISLSVLTKSVFTLVAAVSVAVMFAQPAAAQTAKSLNCGGCVKSKQLKNNGIKGKDMKPTISLGTSSGAGNFSVKDTAGTPTASLEGGSGNVTNSLSGDGVVKAWARINANGTVASCYRCNLDPAETRRVSLGVYEVDFTPLGTDISTRPRSCVSERFVQVAPQQAQDNICGTANSSDTSTVNVNLWDGGRAANTREDGDFTILIY